MRKIKTDGAHPKNKKGVFRHCAKEQKMKTKKFTGRIAAFALVILLILTVLVSCSNGKKDEPQLKMNADVFLLNEEDWKNHAMGVGDLKKIATLIQDASTTSVNYDGREGLVAANRGFDMITEDLSTITDFSDRGYLNIDAVKNVVLKANSALSEKGKECLSTEAIDAIFAKWDSTEEKVVTDDMRRADVELIIAAFREDIGVEEKKFSMDSVLVFIGKILGWITTYPGFSFYVIGICLFAIVIEILMLPFSIKQQKNSIKQANLRPKEMAIKNKYKGRNDQPTMQKMQSEIQELYQRENYSPYSGCLPLIVQMPIVIALYNIVTTSWVSLCCTPSWKHFLKWQKMAIFAASSPPTELFLINAEICFFAQRHCTRSVFPFIHMKQTMQVSL